MAISKINYGNTTLIDLTSDTVTTETLAKGITAHDASGAKITGTLESGGGGSSDVKFTTVTFEGEYLNLVNFYSTYLGRIMRYNDNSLPIGSAIIAIGANSSITGDSVYTFCECEPASACFRDTFFDGIDRENDVEIGICIIMVVEGLKISNPQTM